MLTMKTNFWLQSGMLATRRSIGSVQRSMMLESIKAMKRAKITVGRPLARAELVPIGRSLCHYLLTSTL